MIKTLIVQIGNSDDKLTQKEWAVYCSEIHSSMNSYCVDIHFNGCSDGSHPWQNMCIVGEVPAGNVGGLKDQLRSIRERWHQDSVAILVGDSEFI